MRAEGARCEERADAWALRAVCEWQTGAWEQALESLARAQSLSRVDTRVDGVKKALLFSREQRQDFREMITPER